MIDLKQVKQDKRSAFELLCRIADDINAYAMEISELIESDTACTRLPDVTALVSKNRDRFNTFESVVLEYAKKSVLIQYVGIKSNMYTNIIDSLVVGVDSDLPLIKRWTITQK